MSGLFKGPLPVLILAGAVFLAYKYVPFSQIVDRFRQAEPVSATVTAPSARSDAPVAASAPAGIDHAADKPGAGARMMPLEPDDGPAQPTNSASEAAADIKAPQPILVQTHQPTIGLSNETSAVTSYDPQETGLTGIGALSGNDNVQLVGTMNNAKVGTGVTTGIGGIGVPLPPGVGVVGSGSVQTATPTAKPPTEKPTIVAAPDPVPVSVDPAEKSKNTADKPVVTRKPKAPAQEPKVAKKPAAVVAKVDKPAAPSKSAASTAPPPATVAALRILVEAETHDRADTDQYTPTQYAAMLRKELIAVAGGYLGGENVRAADANLAFRDDLADGRPGVDRLCDRAGSERLLLADLSVPSEGFSRFDSAYWPEVVFTAINCRDGRLHKSQKIRLEPSRLDRFEYQHGFAERSQQFVASQAYFLKP